MFIVFTNEPPPLIPPQGGKAPTNQFIFGIVASNFKKPEIPNFKCIPTLNSQLSSLNSRSIHDDKVPPSKLSLRDTIVRKRSCVPFGGKKSLKTD